VSLQVVLRLVLDRFDTCLKAKKALSFTLTPWNNLRYNVSPLVVLRLMLLCFMLLLAVFLLQFFSFMFTKAGSFYLHLD